MSHKIGRFWQFDVIRGIMILLMIYYHFMWDLYFFGLYPNDVAAGNWLVAARIGAGIFMLLVGISITLAGENTPAPARNRAWWDRGIRLLIYAFIITAVTWVFLREGFILYGVLHLVGTSTLLAPLLWYIRRAAPFIGAVIIWVGTVAAGLHVDTYWLLPFGLAPADYAAVDYFPIAPWLGIIMLGIGLGQAWLALARKYSITPGPPPKFLAPVAAAGRQSLRIYMLHQPVLLVGFWIFGYSVW